MQISAIEEIAIKLFNAYNDCGSNPWKTFDGRDVPRWPELSDQVQTKWKKVAETAVEMCFEKD